MPKSCAAGSIVQLAALYWPMPSSPLPASEEFMTIPTPEERQCWEGNGYLILEQAMVGKDLLRLQEAFLLQKAFLNF